MIPARVIVAIAALALAPVAIAASATAPPVVDTWMGVVAAMGCGLGLKNFPAIAGAGVGAIAGVVALCAFMLLDGMGTPDSP